MQPKASYRNDQNSDIIKKFSEGKYRKFINIIIIHDHYAMIFILKTFAENWDMAELELFKNFEKIFI